MWAKTKKGNHRSPCFHGAQAASVLYGDGSPWDAWMNTSSVSQSLTHFVTCSLMQVLYDVIFSSALPDFLYAIGLLFLPVLLLIIWRSIFLTIELPLKPVQCTWILIFCIIWFNNLPFVCLYSSLVFIRTWLRYVRVFAIANPSAVYLSVVCL